MVIAIADSDACCQWNHLRRNAAISSTDLLLLAAAVSTAVATTTTTTVSKWNNPFVACHVRLTLDLVWI
jgi:hypothetical protein